MAVPKKKVSRSRRNMRRFGGGKSLAQPALTVCQHCHQPTRPHRVCLCGYYGEIQVYQTRSQQRLAQSES